MNTLLLFGVGQLGRLFAGGALRTGVTVVPIRRSTDVGPLWSAYAPGTPILMAVGEGDLEAAVDRVPRDRRDDLIFVQNELYPSDLTSHGAEGATLGLVWTNQKAGAPTLVGRGTAASGPHADAFCSWHHELAIPCRVADRHDIAVEAAAKYAFIVCVNALGLVDARSVGDWQQADSARVESLLAESVRLASARLGEPAVAPETLSRVRDALRGFASLPTRGRSSPSRVARAVALAAELGCDVPELASLSTV